VQASNSNSNSNSNQEEEDESTTVVIVSQHALMLPKDCTFPLKQKFCVVSCFANKVSDRIEERVVNPRVAEKAAFDVYFVEVIGWNMRFWRAQAVHQGLVA
jgi:hypothetical protein